MLDEPGRKTRMTQGVVNKGMPGRKRTRHVVWSESARMWTGSDANRGTAGQKEKHV